MDKSFLLTDLYKNAELKTYTSLTSLSKATGVPKKLLSAARKNNCVGFLANQTVNWSKAKIPFEVMLEDIEARAHDDIAYWKKENAKKDATLKELQIKKMEKDMIEPEEAKNLLVELATQQSVTIKRVFSELPPKVAGKDEVSCKIILDEAMKELFCVLKDKIENWK